MMAKQPFIAVVGSANVDLTTFNDVFPRPGETIFGKKFDLGFGGKGANQAFAARLCGAHVGMVARVGSDLFGPATIRNFESQGIDASCVPITEGVSSGVAPIFVEPSGQNRIMVVRALTTGFLLKTWMQRARCSSKRTPSFCSLRFRCAPFITRCNLPAPTASDASFNPAPAQPVDFKELAAADYFIPNETEAEAITGMPVKSVEQQSCARHFCCARECGEWS